MIDCLQVRSRGERPFARTEVRRVKGSYYTFPITYGSYLERL